MEDHYTMDYTKTTKNSFSRKKWIFSILILLIFCSILFTLLSSIPLNEEIEPDLLSFNPQAAGLFYLSACLSVFLSICGLVIMYLKKISSKVLLSCLLLCLFVSGYRMVSIQQYDDDCIHVQSSVCMVGKPKSLPLW